MKTLGLIGLAAVLVLASAGLAFSGSGENFTDSAWRAGAAADSGAGAAVSPDDGGHATHEHDCSHWWGPVVPGHGARCCGSDHDDGRRHGGHGCC